VSAKKKTRRTMSDEHKQAIAEARRQNRAVRDYLNGLTTAKPAGRRPTATPEELQEQIDAEGDPVKRLELIQRRLDLDLRAALPLSRICRTSRPWKRHLSRSRLTTRRARASPTPPSANSAFPLPPSSKPASPAPAARADRAIKAHASRILNARPLATVGASVEPAADSVGSGWRPAMQLPALFFTGRTCSQRPVPVLSEDGVQAPIVPALSAFADARTARSCRSSRQLAAAGRAPPIA
jgi:hypothetical protein